MPSASLTIATPAEDLGAVEDGFPRRALPARLVGLLAAGVGLALRPDPAVAANGGSVLLGKSNSATLTTQITNTPATTASIVGLQGTGPIGVSGKTSVKTSPNAGVQGIAAGTTTYGVFSSGKLGATGPIELASCSITSWASPVTPRSYLYARANGTLTELRFKTPLLDVLITTG